MAPFGPWGHPQWGNKREVLRVMWLVALIHCATWPKRKKQGPAPRLETRFQTSWRPHMSDEGGGERGGRWYFNKLWVSPWYPSEFCIFQKIALSHVIPASLCIKDALRSSIRADLDTSEHPCKEDLFGGFNIYVPAQLIYLKTCTLLNVFQVWLSSTSRILMSLFFNLFKKLF